LSYKFNILSRNKTVVNSVITWIKLTNFIIVFNNKRAL